eukprot:jgi/Undpi1/11074/HiC_scaffold_30.g13372.m1
MGASVLYLCAAALPLEHNLEIRELRRKQVFVDRETMNINQAQLELLSKKSSWSAHSLVADGGCGEGDGQGSVGEKGSAKNGGRGAGDNDGNSSRSQKRGENGVAAGAEKQPGPRSQCVSTWPRSPATAR